MMQRLSIAIWLTVFVHLNVGMAYAAVIEIPLTIALDSSQIALGGISAGGQLMTWSVDEPLDSPVTVSPGDRIEFNLVFANREHLEVFDTAHLPL